MWPRPVRAGSEHPILSAAVQVGDRDEWVFTGRLSTDTQPWAARPVLLGTVLVPGTALVELALAAGRQVDCSLLDELVLEAPLVLRTTSPSRSRSPLVRPPRTVAARSRSTPVHRPVRTTGRRRPPVMGAAG